MFLRQISTPLSHHHFPTRSPSPIGFFLSVFLLFVKFSRLSVFSLKKSKVSVWMLSVFLYFRKSISLGLSVFYHILKYYQFVFYQFLLFSEFISVWNYKISCILDKNPVFSWRPQDLGRFGNRMIITITDFTILPFE